MNNDLLNEFLVDIDELQNIDNISFEAMIESNVDRKNIFKSELSKKRQKINDVRLKLQNCVNKNIFSVADAEKLFNRLNNLDYSIDKLIKTENPSFDDFFKVYDDFFEKYNSVNKEKDRLLSKHLKQIEDDISNGKISPEYVENILKNTNLTKEEVEKYNKILENVRAKNNSDNNTEQQSIKDEGLSNESASIGGSGTHTSNNTETNSTTNDSFEREFKELNYKEDENLIENAKLLIVEHEIDELDNEINKLNAKKEKNGRLSLIETIKLQNLIEKRTSYERLFIESNILQDFREYEMDKINSMKEALSTTRDNINVNEHKSFIGRFVSQKAVNKLDKSIERLNKAQGKIVGKQKASAITSLKIQKSIIKAKAAFKTTVKVTKKVPGEIKNTYHDISNFISQFKRIDDLKGKQGTITAMPLALNVQLYTNEASHAL